MQNILAFLSRLPGSTILGAIAIVLINLAEIVGYKFVPGFESSAQSVIALWDEANVALLTVVTLSLLAIATLVAAFGRAIQTGGKDPKTDPMVLLSAGLAIVVTRTLVVSANSDASFLLTIAQGAIAALHLFTAITNFYADRNASSSDMDS